MRPGFPLIQVDLERWSLDLMAELFLFDDLYRSKDHKFYADYLENKPFLDSNGQIFLAKDKTELKDFWSKMGLRKKYKINFEATDEKWTFDEVKSFLTSKINALSPDDGKEEWIQALSRATTIRQLIEAER